MGAEGGFGAANSCSECASVSGAMTRRINGGCRALWDRASLTRLDRVTFRPEGLGVRSAIEHSGDQGAGFGELVRLVRVRQECKEPSRRKGACLHSGCCRTGYQRLRSLAIDRCRSAGLHGFSQVDGVSVGAFAKDAQRRALLCQ